MEVIDRTQFPRCLQGNDMSPSKLGRNIWLIGAMTEVGKDRTISGKLSK